MEAVAAASIEGTVQRALDTTEMSFKPLLDLLTPHHETLVCRLRLEDALRHGDILWCLLVGE